MILDTLAALADFTDGKMDGNIDSNEVLEKILDLKSRGLITVDYEYLTIGNRKISNPVAHKLKIFSTDCASGKRTDFTEVEGDINSVIDYRTNLYYDGVTLREDQSTNTDNGGYSPSQEFFVFYQTKNEIFQDRTFKTSPEISLPAFLSNNYVGTHDGGGITSRETITLSGTAPLTFGLWVKGYCSINRDPFLYVVNTYSGKFGPYIGERVSLLVKNKITEEIVLIGLPVELADVNTWRFVASQWSEPYIYIGSNGNWTSTGGIEDTSNYYVNSTINLSNIVSLGQNGAFNGFFIAEKSLTWPELRVIAEASLPDGAVLW